MSSLKSEALQLLSRLEDVFYRPFRTIDLMRVKLNRNLDSFNSFLSNSTIESPDKFSNERKRKINLSRICRKN